ncbi:MAG: DNA recombination protein RmuC, partial [Bacteroidia bacterium]|nr:DNA recombination protein RmuC [Bacteroidia bacterium]
MDNEILIGIILLLAVINTLLLIKKKPQQALPLEKLKEIENAVIKFDAVLERNEKSIKDEFQRNRQESSASAKENRNELTKNMRSFADTNTINNKDLNEGIRQKFEDFGKQQSDLSKLSVQSIKEVKDSIEKQLHAIREDNTQQLSEMRKTVDEKLQTTLEKRLGESFKLVSERLEQVHKGLGEMQNIATGVGDLKKVLSNVKTRGILGEYQLENILEQLLTTDQYSKNVATKKGSQAHVEFAIKLPGKDSDEDVWMPIDSKFPIENYEILQ